MNLCGKRVGLALSGLLLSTSCVAGVSSIEVRIFMWTSPGASGVTPLCRSASAVAGWKVLTPGEYPWVSGSMGAMEENQVCTSSGVVSAASSTGWDESCGPGTGCYAYADVHPNFIYAEAPGEWPAIALRTRQEFGVCWWNQFDCTPYKLVLLSLAQAKGTLTLSNSFSGTLYSLASVPSTITQYVCSNGVARNAHRSSIEPIHRSWVRLSTPSGSSSIALFSNDLGVTAINATPGGTPGEYDASPTVASLTAGQTLSASVITMRDSDFDLNGDGRFDQGDVSWVESRFRQLSLMETSLGVLENFVQDWPNDEYIDEADSNYLQALLNSVGPTPLFGDFNRDGTIDCRDAVGASAYFGIQVGDPDYRYELDADRDGVVDESDKAAFFALVNHCDFNQDEVVDDADGVIFAAAYNLLDCADPAMPAYCPADLNLDGYVDDADFIIFAVRYNNLEC